MRLSTRAVHFRVREKGQGGKARLQPPACQHLRTMQHHAAPGASAPGASAPCSTCSTMQHLDIPLMGGVVACATHAHFFACCMHAMCRLNIRAGLCMHAHICMWNAMCASLHAACAPCAAAAHALMHATHGACRAAEVYAAGKAEVNGHAPLGLVKVRMAAQLVYAARPRPPRGNGARQLSSVCCIVKWELMRHAQSAAARLASISVVTRGSQMGLRLPGVEAQCGCSLSSAVS